MGGEISHGVIAAIGSTLVTGCGDGSTDVDQALSNRLRQGYARCLGLPLDSVQLEVDTERRLVFSGWVADRGETLQATDGECFDQLRIEWMPVELDEG